MKKITLIILTFFAYNIVHCQSLTKDDVVNGLTGTWKLVYKDHDTLSDASCIVEKVTYIMNGKRGKEIGVFKDGKISESVITWEFIKCYKKGYIKIVFKGGFWIRDQEFIITKITKDKIMMLSPSKDFEEEVYFVKL